MMGLKIRDLFVKVYHPKSRAWASFKLRMHHKAHMSCAPDALAARLRLSSSTSSDNNNNNIIIVNNNITAITNTHVSLSIAIILERPSWSSSNQGRQRRKPPRIADAASQAPVPNFVSKQRFGFRAS